MGILSFWLSGKDMGIMTIHGLESRRWAMPKRQLGNF